jgi:Transposase DDE domain
LAYQVAFVRLFDRFPQQQPFAFSGRATATPSIRWSICSTSTSLYFEGHAGESIGQRGHTKDHRSDLKQMVVGMAVDVEGRPICCEMWPGNTADVTTLVPIVKRMRERFRIREITVVADRGMVSQATLEAALLLKTELQRRMKFADLQCEWAQVLRGLEALQQVEATFQDKRFLLRNPLTGEASAALRATGVAAPATLRELP